MIDDSVKIMKIFEDNYWLLLLPIHFDSYMYTYTYMQKSIYSRYIYSHTRLIVHPNAVSLTLSSSASAFLQEALSTQGVFSTMSLASLRPKLNIDLTSLMILIFEAGSIADSSTS